VADNFAPDANSQTVSIENIPDGWMGLDIGPDSIKVFQDALADCNAVIWNGPMGVFEMSNFAEGTKAVAKAVVDATKEGAFSLIGGGDSAAAVNTLGYGEDVSYVSTGGGALLEYMEGKELPGIEVLRK
jgi:phosphoglycerate kinase